MAIFNNTNLSANAGAETTTTRLHGSRAERYPSLHRKQEQIAQAMGVTLPAAKPKAKPKAKKFTHQQLKNPKPVVKTTVKDRRPAAKTAEVENAAGGTAYAMSSKMEFLFLCLTTALNMNGRTPERMYLTEAQRLQKIQALLPTVGVKYAAQVALFCRLVFGLRTISHVLAAAIAYPASGKNYRGRNFARAFYRQIALRPDDIGEALGAFIAIHPEAFREVEKILIRNGVKHVKKVKHIKLPEGMKDGFAQAFDKWGAYQLGKYIGESKGFTLYDVANLVHPKPTAKNEKALRELMAGTLVNKDTWEYQLSEAGNSGEAKKKVWERLIREGKLGPLALLRNLRNIADVVSPNYLKDALNQLRDHGMIKKLKILPFQYLRAYNVIKAADSIPAVRKLDILAAIDDAVELAAGNVPSLGDNVLIAVDTSGSMQAFEREHATLMAAILLKANPKADVMLFATDAKYITNRLNRKLPVMELQAQMHNLLACGSTNFNSIFEVADKAYDSIVILSDQEGWVHPQTKARGGAPDVTHQAYRLKWKCIPSIFTFDLGGSGTLMFNEDGSYNLAGFSFEVFKLLALLREKRTKLVEIVSSIEIGQPMPSLDLQEGEED